MHSVAETIRTLLPRGTRALSDTTPPSWELAPPHPADVFAVAASLLKRSGAYQYILAEPGVSTNGYALLVDDTLRNQIERSASQWRTITDPNEVPRAVSIGWSILSSCNEPLILIEEPDPSLVAREKIAWWRTAMELMFIADVAAAGLGFFDDDTDPQAWYFPVTRKVLSLEEAQEDGRSVPPSISQIPPAMNCVLPKSRTSSVGCTLRSLSHNLCLLPASGVASARWCDPRASNIKSDDQPLNILLVPFPYRVPADAFDPNPRNSLKWDSFKFRQTWLDDTITAKKAFINFVKDLINDAASEVPGVDAIVFPEVSLNWEFFSALMKELERRSDVQFLTAGLGTNEFGEEGNFIATAIFYNTPRGRATSVVVRPKHHRWKLERQIRRYALSAYLDPEKTWWENFNITQREVHVLRFRKNSTIATLICEDLARVDPCQELIRSIGPNLVLVLLMDGPQLRPRWPGRYATVLADDPGSSVLTLTCLGMIDRQNESRYERWPVIALWKDDRDDAREITLARGDHALIVSLTPRRRDFCFSMDGRKRPTIAWYLGGIHPVRVAHNPYA